MKVKVVHHLPLITTEELAVLLSAINACTTTGTLWDRQQWSQQLGRDFTSYGNSDVESAYPPVATAPPVDASDNEAQTVEVSQFPTSATVAQPSAQDEPLTFRLEDQDAPTEPEIPIPLEAMHASMTTEDARRILLDHPLPRARQRTNPRVVNHASASPAAIEPSSQDQDRCEADKPTIMVSPSPEEVSSRNGACKIM